MNSFDITIIGAGIVGSAIARQCAQAGMSVAVVEGGVPGAATTAAGMGHIVVMDDSPAQLALTNYSRKLWLEERDHLPRCVEYECTGTLWIAADGEEMAEVYAKQQSYSRLHISTQVLDAHQLAQAEPSLRPGLAGALRVPEDGVLYPPTAARYFLDEAIRLGAQLFLSRALSAAQGKVKLANGIELAAAHIVLAVGTENDLLASLPIQKRKGHLAITDRYPGLIHHQLVELGYLKSAHKLVTDSVAFNIQPRQTGQLLIGSSRQYGNQNSQVDTAILRRMLDRSTSYMPCLADLSILRIWTGFRAALPDKLPLIGPAAGLSDDPTLWLAVGFEGLGITNAPGAARLLTDSLLGRTPAIDATPFLPLRLAQSEPVHA